MVTIWSARSRSRSKSAERDDFLAALNQMLAARAAVVQAQAELASLYREREIAQARAVERDPIIALH